MESNAFFKVLDIYKIGDKTQVFLLEIPATAVDFFASVTSNIEEDITKKAKENFETKIDAEPIPELQTEEWKKRTAFLIGMNDKGELFYQVENKNPIWADENTEIKDDDITKNQSKQKKSWWKFR